MSDVAVSFDLDGVLMPSPLRQTVFASLWKVLGEFWAHEQGISLEEAQAQLADMVGAQRNRRIAAGDLVGAYDWDAIIGSVAWSLGYGQGFSIAQMVEERCRDAESLPGYPEVPGVLGRLSEMGVYMVVITNGYARYQMPVLRALGLVPYFQRIVTSDLVGHAKPEREIFEYAFDDVAPGRRYHVGDLLSQDVAGANAAGVHSIWLKRDLPESFRPRAPSQRPGLAGFLEYMGSVLKQEEALPTTQKSLVPQYVVWRLEEVEALIAA
jgi:FMN phosphatase YigB (HAD superfamily)